MVQAPTSFTVATAPEPHRIRTRQIIKAHPEVKQLMTRNPTTLLIGAACVAAQVVLAYLLRNQAMSTKREVWEDMLQVMERLQMPVSERQRGFFLSKPGG